MPVEKYGASVSPEVGLTVAGAPPGKYTLKVDTKSWWLFIESDFLKDFGTTEPAPGTYTYDAGATVKVEAKPVVFGTIFDRWVLDGVEDRENPITITMDKDHALTAYFIPVQVIAGGAGAIVLTVAAASYEERRRRETLMLAVR
jgi:hypothetical protein